MSPVILEASLVKVFEVILIILIAYYTFTFVMRLIIPSLMRKYVSDFQKRFTEQNQHVRQTSQQKKEGEISITFVDKDKNVNRTPDSGEYVDYEEIK